MSAAHAHRFGDLIRRFRQASGMTQDELAARAGLTARHIGEIERGTRRTAHAEVVAALIEALRLSEPEAALVRGVSGGNYPPRATTGLSPLAHPSAGPTIERNAPRFVGRATELALIERHLAADDARQGTLVWLLTGAPGIGKTRLLHEAAQQARGAGWTVLMGGCQRRGGQEPFAPFVDALASHLATLAPAQRAALLRGCSWLVRLLPELHDEQLSPVPAWGSQPEQERRLMFAAVGRYLANAAGTAGTLLLLDDLQWAGVDALDLLSSLVDGSAAAPLRIIGAYRDIHMTPQSTLGQALADLACTSRVTHTRLEPLTPDEAATLLDQVLQVPASEHAAISERLIDRTGRVPFLLVACARSVTPGEQFTEGADDVPWSVAQMIRQQVASLPEPARELLGVAAVMGREVQRTVLTSVLRDLGWDEQQIIESLEAVCYARLMQEAGTTRYAFAHNLLREVISADLSAARCAALHRHIAEALEREPGAPATTQLAFHYACSGEGEKAIRYLEESGDRAVALHAHAKAECAYHDLVTRLDALGRSAEAARIREKLAATLTSTAHYASALEVLEQAVQLYTAADDLEGIARATAQLGMIHAQRGTPEEGIVRLNPLADLLSGSRLSLRGLALLYLALARLYMVNGRYRDELIAAVRAAELARTIRDASLLAEAEMRRGDALQSLGRIEEAAQALEGAIPLAEGAGDQINLCFALKNVASAYCAWGEYEHELKYTQEAYAVAVRLHDPTLTAYILHQRGMARFALGWWRQARTDMEQAAALVRESGTSWVSPYPPLGLGLVALAEGRLPEAEHLLGEATILAERSGDVQAQRQAQVGLAERDLLHGAPARARDRLLPLLDRPGEQEGQVTTLLPLLAWAYLELGDEAAEATIIESIARASTQNIRAALLDARRIQAQLCARRQRWQEAERSIHTALDLSRTMRYPYGEARALYSAALVHIEMGAPQQARECLESASAILESLGEHLYRRQVRHLLALLRSPRRARHTGTYQTATALSQPNQSATPPQKPA